MKHVLYITAQKKKFSIKDFFSKYKQIHRKVRIWSHVLKKPLMENFIFCAVRGVFCTVKENEKQSAIMQDKMYGKNVIISRKTLFDRVNDDHESRTKAALVVINQSSSDLKGNRN